MAKKLKDMIKKNPVANPTFGTDPSNPWATKYNVSEATETELLARYLNSRGINPHFVPKDTKIAHAKSAEYAKWKADHMERFAREEVEQIDELHPSTMASYILKTSSKDPKRAEPRKKIMSKLAKVMAKQPVDPKAPKYSTNVVGEEKKLTSLEKFRKASAEREKKHAEIEKQSKEKPDMKGAIDRLEKHLNKEAADAGISKAKETSFHKKLDKLVHSTFGKRKDEMKMKEEVEQIDEISDKTLSSYKEKAKKSADELDAQKKFGKSLKRRTGVLSATSKMVGRAGEKIGQLAKEDAFQDTYAATQMPFDGANTTNDTSMKREMSKSARIIKSIYKRKNMKEEMADWEKEDKSVQSYGKKPKLDMTDKKSNIGENKPEARAVMTGGKTLTGQDRDMVEIDPAMKTRPDRPDTFDKGYPKKSPA